MFSLAWAAGSRCNLVSSLPFTSSVCSEKRRVRTRPYMSIPISFAFFQMVIDSSTVWCKLQRGRVLSGFSSPSPHWRQPAQGIAASNSVLRPGASKKQKRPKGGGASAMLWTGALSCCRAQTRASSPAPANDRAPNSRFFMSAGHDDDLVRLQSMLPGLSPWLSDTLYLLLVTDVFRNDCLYFFYRICRRPARLWGFAAQGVAERGSRVGEADRTELLQLQQKSGESGEGSLHPGLWRWRWKWRWRPRWR